ncbi:MAG: hypothetical protein RLZZ385_347 [Pseudomonadota bacterium]|jgi:hypothetical protein
MASEADDLGFAYRASKNGDLEITRGGKFATRFSGTRGEKYASRLAELDFRGQQQLMARLTGNYKRN